MPSSRSGSEIDPNSMRCGWKDCSRVVPVPVGEPLGANEEIVAATTGKHVRLSLLRVEPVAAVPAEQPVAARSSADSVAVIACLHHVVAAERDDDIRDRATP